MRRLFLWTALILVAGACSNDVTTVRTSPATSGATIATDTTTATLPTVSTTRPLRPDISLIVPRLGGVDLLTDGDGIELEGDADYPVMAAFDDLAGGLIYQYEVTPEQFSPHSILHIAAGGSTPEAILSADPGRTIRLLDVEIVEGRTNVLYLEGPEGADPDSLFIADLAGGAPTPVALADPDAEPGSAGVTPTAILNGSLSERGVAVVWWYGDIEAACSYAEVVDFEGTILYGPVPEVCGENNVGYVALSADGARLAYVGEETVVASDIDTGEVLGEWPAAGMTGLDFDGSTVIVMDADGYTILSLRGESPASFELPLAATRIVAARGPIDLAAGTFLGGVRPLSSSCSAAGMSETPDSQGGLPEAVATTRAAIVAAATACDINALSGLAADTLSYSFGVAQDPSRFWRQIEQQGGGVLARIVSVLSLPYVVLNVDDTRVYAWPSAIQEQPTAADWEALAAVYNEEDIDLFKAYGGYIGMRVAIAEDGTWTLAIEGD